MIRVPENHFRKAFGPIQFHPPKELDVLLESASIDIQLPLVAAARLHRLLSQNDQVLQFIRGLPWEDSLSFAHLLGGLSEGLPEIEGRDLLQIPIHTRNLEGLLQWTLDAISDEKDRRRAIESLEALVPGGFSQFTNPLTCDSGTLVVAFREGMDDERRWKDAELQFTELSEREVQAMDFWDLLAFAEKC